MAYPEEANEVMLTVEKEGKKAVEMAQALANGGEQEASATLVSVWPLTNLICVKFSRFSTSSHVQR